MECACEDKDGEVVSLCGAHQKVVDARVEKAPEAAYEQAVDDGWNAALQNAANAINKMAASRPAQQEVLASAAALVLTLRR